jgi:multicomponent Na+:H+ antiporter subunit D
MIAPASNVLMVLAVFVPLAAAALIPLFRDRPNLRESVTLTAAGATAVIVLLLLPDVIAGARPTAILIEIIPGMPIAFALEPLGMLFALIVALLWIANSVYSIGYMRANREAHQTGFYVYFAIAIASALGVAFSGNLVTLFLFYEILTLSTYPLVTHKRNAEAVAAGRVYLVMLLGTSTLLLLPAVILVAIVAGRIDFAPAGILPDGLAPATVAVLLALFVFGIGKAAVMPLHAWLPAAMVAPTPVSALLHAVAVVKAGVFAILKVIVMTFGIERLAASGAGDWLAWIAGASVIAASVMALRQQNLKRRLAYSTVSQLSYVVLAAALLTPLSIIGAALHIAGHAVSKITLFFAAGSIYTAAHKTEISELDGIGRRMPWTMAAFAIGSLGMIGLPPTAGFLGKWFMLSGAMQTGQWAAVVVIVLSTVLNAAYFLPIVARAFLTAPADGRHADIHEAPLPILLAIGATALATLALFFLPGTPLALSTALVGG